MLDFLVCAMQSGNNMYVGTMKKIAVNINSSKATVQSDGLLADKGFVAMQLDGVWLINPSMVIKGNRSKEKVLMDKFILIQREYDEKRKARKNSKRKEADKEKQQHRYADAIINYGRQNHCPYCFTHLATVFASVPYNCAIWYMLAPD